VVTIDNTLPTSTIYFPVSSGNYNSASWNGGCSSSICGTATDPPPNSTGVSVVKVSIQSTSGANSGKYWNGTTFSSVSELLFSASTSNSWANWTLSFPAANLPVDGTYTVRSYATDNATNVQTPATAASFTYDTVKPVTTITITPASANGSLGWYKTTAPTFTLSATDTGGSGVASTFYKIDAGTTQTYSSAVTIPEGQHTISYWSTDNAGNTETTNTTTTFKVDTVTPANVLSLGSASGAFLNGTTLYYKSDAAGSFTVVNGVTDATSGPASATFPGLTGTNWTAHSAETVSTPSGGPYASSLYQWSTGAGAPSTTALTATDTAGNTNTGTALTFTSDTAATAPTITFPSPTSYNNTSWNAACASTICGTSTDAGAGVQKLEVSIRQGSGNYWNGSTFSSASQVWNQASGTTNWSYGFTGANFPAEGSYAVSARTTDNVGNVSGLSTVTVTIDRTQPTVSDVTISGGTAGKAEATDTIVITFSEAVSATSICSSWVNDGTTQAILGNNDGGGNNGASVSVNDNAISGNDSVTFNMGTACSAGGHVGSINLGSSAYVSATVSFHGNGTNKTTTYSYSPTTKKLTITLGQANGGTVCTSGCPSTSNATTTPDPLITDLAGNAITGTFSKNGSQF
jgi:hypothetical protein